MAMSSRRTAYLLRHPLIELFDAHVNENGPVVRTPLGPCHIWTGKIRGRYGWFTVGDSHDPAVSEKATRFIWAHHHGPIPQGLGVLHHCDNPPCVKAVADAFGPSHLFLGTQRDNMHDMIAKGRRYQPYSAGIRNGRAKITEDDVREIRASSDAHDACAVRFGLSKIVVRRIRARLLWRHVL